MDKHYEYITCYECKDVQRAIVQHTEPWHTYIHRCTKCGYVNMESDWIKLSEHNSWKAEKVRLMAILVRKMEAIQRILKMRMIRAEAITDQWQKLFFITESLRLQAWFGGLRMSGEFIISQPLPRIDLGSLGIVGEQGPEYVYTILNEACGITCDFNKDPHTTTFTYSGKFPTKPNNR